MSRVDSEHDPIRRNMLAMLATAAQAYYAKLSLLSGQQGQAAVGKASAGFGDAFRDLMATSKDFFKMVGDLNKLPS